MKVQHFLSGATLLSAALLLNAPLSAAVESDVVGYTTIKTEPGANMVGVVFNGLDGEPITLGNLLNGDIHDFDYLQIRDKTTGGYRVYSYENGVWYDDSFNNASDLLWPPGSTFWFTAPERSVTLTMKGSVLIGTYTQKFQAGLNMISPGVPKEIALNGDIVWENLPDYSTIQVKNGERYELFTYEAGKWWDANFTETTYKIPVGSSVWLTTATGDAQMSVNGATK